MTIIRKDLIEDMFDGMKKSKWNIDGNLLWGYFFYDPDPKKLETLAQHFDESGYSFVDIYPNEEDDVFWLRVERIEKHTVSSLDKRNMGLHKLARKLKVQEYDDMDAGPVPDK